MHKTGTTTIQRNLYQNRAVLRESSNVQYLPLGSNHSILATLFLDSPEQVRSNIFRGLGNREMCRQHHKVLQDGLINYLNQNRQSDIIISGEDFSLLKREDVQKLSNFLQVHFEQIKIVIYTRHPFEFARSYGQQKIKVGSTIDQVLEASFAIVDSNRHHWFTDESDIRPHFQKRIAPFQFYFGKENVQIIDLGNLQKGDLNAANFLRSVGIDFEGNLSSEGQNYNKSLSNSEVYLINSINRSHSYKNGDQYNNSRAHPIHLLAKMGMSSEKFTFDQLDLSKFAQHIQEDVSWLRSTTNGNIDYVLSTFDDDEQILPNTKIETLNLESRGLQLNEELLLKQNKKIKKRFSVLFNQKEKMLPMEIFQLVNRCSSVSLLTEVLKHFLTLNMVNEATLVRTKILRLNPENNCALQSGPSNQVTYSFEKWYGPETWT